MEPRFAAAVAAACVMGAVLGLVPAPAMSASAARPRVVVVDDDTPGRFDAAASWRTSTWNVQRHGPGYHYATPSRRADYAMFRIPVATTGRYDVSAWWPADRGYSASTPFRITTADGLRWSRVDQRVQGGRWVRLGTYRLERGDAWIVAVSAGTRSHGLVIADAVRVAPAPEPGAGPPTGRAPARAPLDLGSKGDRVRALQRRLSGLGYLPGSGADGSFGMQTWHAVVAFQGWALGTRTGIVTARTQAALESARRPVPWARVRRALELDLRRQVLLLVADGVTVRAVHVSSAAPGYHTPRGTFRVYRREPRSWSSQYNVWLPHALYFQEGHAFHGYPSVPLFPASHGCVRVPLADAPSVYAFAQLGTPVLVR